MANHYPERMNKVFIVDAPTLFWVLHKARAPRGRAPPRLAPRAPRPAPRARGAAPPGRRRPALNAAPRPRRRRRRPQAVSPFLDPVTRAKIEFVYSANFKAGDAPAAAAPEGGAASAVTANVALADSPEARFVPFLPHYRAPFDKAGHFEKLAAFGWPR